MTVSEWIIMFVGGGLSLAVVSWVIAWAILVYRPRRKELDEQWNAIGRAYFDSMQHVTEERQRDLRRWGR